MTGVAIEPATRHVQGVTTGVPSMKRLLPLLLLAAAPALAAQAPHVSAPSFEQLAKPLPLPYAEGADADAAIAAGKARALKAHRKLLIDLGGNWCLDCRLLAGTMELPEVSRFVRAHYEVVPVDIGRWDKNRQVSEHYGIHGRLAGVPAVLIVDPKTDKLLNRGHETALSDARTLTPQALADWLAQWA